MMEKILLATSIAPFDFENQQKAVASWIKAGFDVVSYNAKVEIDIIKAHFPALRFTEMKRDASAELGKPYPYAYDLLCALRQENSKVCGYINSDIHICDFPSGLMQEIYDSAKAGEFVFANRMETVSLKKQDRENAWSYRGGIDLFIFGSQLFDIYTDDGLIVGNVLWDFWIVSVAALNGTRMREIKNPVFYHISHAIRWNKEMHKKFIKIIADKYFRGDLKGCPYLIMNIIANTMDGICCTSPMTKKKSVLVILTENVSSQTFESLLLQTHEKLTICDGEFSSDIDVQYDYVFYAAQGQIYDNCAIDLLVEEAIRRSVDAIQSEVALVGGDKRDASTRYVKSLRSRPHENILIKAPHYNIKPVPLGITLSCITMSQIVNVYVPSFKRFYIYPAGEIARILVSCMIKDHNRIDLLGLCDKNDNLWGQSIEGYAVFSPEKLDNNCEYDTVLIASQYEDEIYTELSKTIPENKLVRMNDLLNRY